MHYRDITHVDLIVQLFPGESPKDQLVIIVIRNLPRGIIVDGLSRKFHDILSNIFNVCLRNAILLVSAVILDPLNLKVFVIFNLLGRRPFGFFLELDSRKVGFEGFKVAKWVNWGDTRDPQAPSIYCCSILGLHFIIVY